MSPSYKINFVVYVVYLWMRITVIQLVFYLISEMSDIKVCHFCAKRSIDVNSNKVVPSNCYISHEKETYGRGMEVFSIIAKCRIKFSKKFASQQFHNKTA